MAVKINIPTIEGMTLKTKGKYVADDIFVNVDIPKYDGSNLEGVEVLGNEEFDSKAYYRQTRPKDWLKVNLPSEMEELYPDQDRIEILFETTELNKCISFMLDGTNINIDWGDGTNEKILNAGISTFQKIYDNDLIGKQVLIIITSPKNEITRIDFLTQNRLTNEDGYTYSSYERKRILELSINAKECVLKSMYASVSYFNEMFGNIQYISLDCKLYDSDYFFYGMGELKVFPEFTLRSNHTKFTGFFKECINLRIAPNIDFTYANDIVSMYNECENLVTVGDIYAPNITDISSLFYYCKKLKNIGKLTFGVLTKANRTFYKCLSLIETPLKNVDTSTIVEMSSLYCMCTFKKINIDTTSAQKLNDLVSYNNFLEELELSDTSNALDMGSMLYQCENLKKISPMNIMNITKMNTSWVPQLEKLCLLNIRIALNLSNSLDGLTKNSLIGLIKELVDTGSTLKLTLGSTKLNKITNIYVRLTGEAEEDETNPKLPCEVCESTDEGAMSIIAYANMKNWTLA